MTLDDAIRHCDDRIEEEKRNGHCLCAEEHRQLRDWLKKLRELTEGNK